MVALVIITYFLSVTGVCVNSVFVCTVAVSAPPSPALIQQQDVPPSLPPSLPTARCHKTLKIEAD